MENNIEVIENDFDSIDESFNYQENEQNESVKLERHQINSYSVDRSIDTLLKWKSRGKLRIPDFQRDYVWEYADSVKFIDTILIGLPTPNIFVFKTLENNDEVFTLVDGLQRITTVENYKKGTWTQKGKKDKNFSINLKSSVWCGQKYDDLNENDREAFDDYQFVMTVFEMSSNKTNSEAAMFSLFERINTGSEDLSAQEIRNAVYNGPVLKELKLLSQIRDYKELICKDNATNKRAYDLEILCRAYAYKNIYDRLKVDKTTLIDNQNYIFLNKINNNITTSKIEMINIVMKLANDGIIDQNKQTLNQFKNVFEVIQSNLGSTAFYGKKRGTNIIGNKIHELLMEALIIAVIENNLKINITSEQFNNEKIKLLNSGVFYDNFVQKTTSKDNIVKRVEVISKIIRGE